MMLVMEDPFNKLMKFLPRFYIFSQEIAVVLSKLGICFSAHRQTCICLYGGNYREVLFFILLHYASIFLKTLNSCNIQKTLCINNGHCLHKKNGAACVCVLCSNHNLNHGPPPKSPQTSEPGHGSW